jgi:hypothetical protein
MLATLIYYAVTTAMLVAGIYAFVDALRRPESYFPAADRKTKRFWLALTGLGLAAQIFFPPLGVGLIGLLGVPTNPTLGMVGIVGLVASLVYIVDVIPRLKQVAGGGRSSW